MANHGGRRVAHKVIQDLWPSETSTHT